MARAEMGESDSADREALLDEVIGDYLAAVDAAKAPAPEELIAQHPEIAATLQAQLDARLPAEEAAPAPGKNPVQQMQGHGYW